MCHLVINFSDSVLPQSRLFWFGVFSLNSWQFFSFVAVRLFLPLSLLLKLHIISELSTRYWTSLDKRQLYLNLIPSNNHIFIRLIKSLWSLRAQFTEVFRVLFLFHPDDQLPPKLNFIFITLVFNIIASNDGGFFTWINLFYYCLRIFKSLLSLFFSETSLSN